ncbi:MAG: integrin alpha, partial [Pseudomonadota bacterium]
ALEGSVAGDRLGFDAAALGDIDGDGDDDFAVTLFGASSGAGAVLIVLGNLPDWASTSPEDLTDNDDALLIEGVRGGRLGFSIDSAGDVDGDGTDDLIIGAPGEGDAGAVHLVFGGDGFAERASVLSGEGVVTFLGARGGEEAGYSIATLGDVNGDGFDDFAIGAPSLLVGGGSGAVYVVFGDDARFGGNEIDLSSLDGSNGFVFTAGGLNDFLGRSVSSAGDVNGDGFDDILVSAPFAKFSGQAHLIYGRDDGFSASFGPRDFESGEGATFTGKRFADEFGWPAVAAGDINGDGFDDILFGAHLADGLAGEAGSVDLVLGSADPFDVRALVDNADGYRLDGVFENDFLGVGLSSVGDLNGDGYDEFIAGAPGADPHGVFEAGIAYLVYGSPDVIAPDLPFTDDFA